MNEDYGSRYKTSWTDEHLDKLCIPSNHKITYDGYEYWWMHKINGKKWELHYIEGQEEPTKLLRYLKYSLMRWSKEAEYRKSQYAKKSITRLLEELKITETYVEISNRKDLSIQEKIDLMNTKYRISYIDEVANILKVSPVYVRNYLKKL